jgi:hypothetical protein
MSFQIFTYNHTTHIIYYITREIKPSFYYPCVPNEKIYAGKGFLQVEAAKFCRSKLINGSVQGPVQPCRPEAELVNLPLYLIGLFSRTRFFISLLFTFIIRKITFIIL